MAQISVQPDATDVITAGRQRLLAEPELAPSAFNWGATVLANALLQAHKQIADQECLTTVRHWAQRAINTGGTPHDAGGSLWKMGAGSVFAALADAAAENANDHAEGENQWIGHLQRWLDHLDEIPRLANGIWSSKWDVQQVWVDSLMTLAPTLLAAATTFQRPEYGEQAVDLCLRSAEVLQDEQTGLWWHAWDQTQAAPLGTFWCRGNAWALMAMVQVVDVAPHASDGLSELRQRLQALIIGLLKHQHDDGCWGTVIDDGAATMETSGQALLAAWLKRSVRCGVHTNGDQIAVAANRAWQVVRPYIDVQGNLTEVSLGTGIGDAGAYRAVKTATWPMWGNAAAIHGALAFSRHQATMK